MQEFFDMFSLSLFLEQFRPRDMEAGLVYPGAFCDDILSYKIADTSIAFPSKWQLTWRQPLAVARFSRPLRGPSLPAARPVWSRNFIAIFLICDDYIIIMPHHPRRVLAIGSWMRRYRHESMYQFRQDPYLSAMENWLRFHHDTKWNARIYVK